MENYWGHSVFVSMVLKSLIFEDNSFSWKMALFKSFTSLIHNIRCRYSWSKDISFDITHHSVKKYPARYSSRNSHHWLRLVYMANAFTIFPILLKALNKYFNDSIGLCGKENSISIAVSTYENCFDGKMVAIYNATHLYENTSTFKLWLSVRINT